MAQPSQKWIYAFSSQTARAAFWLSAKLRCSFSGRAFANVLHVFISPLLINGVHCAMTARKKISAIFAAAYNKWANFLVTLSPLRLILKGERVSEWTDEWTITATTYTRSGWASESAHPYIPTHPAGTQTLVRRRCCSPFKCGSWLFCKLKTGSEAPKPKPAEWHI